MSRLHGYEALCVSAGRMRVIAILSWEPLQWMVARRSGKLYPPDTLSQYHQDQITEFLLERLAERRKTI